MIASSTSTNYSKSLQRVTAEFSALEQANATAEIRRLADSGLSELEIIARTGWSRADVCRALGERV